MRDNDKRKSTTFQRIMENNPENIFAQTDGSIKKRHGGLAIKSSRSENSLNEANNDSNVLNKYKYNCLTIIEDQKISKLREEIFNFTKQLEDVKRTNDDLNKKLTIIRENLFELEIIQLKPLLDDLKRKERKMEINKTKKQNTTDSEFREYFALKETISDKELEIEEQRNIKKELNNNIEKNNSKIEELENTISNLNSELDSYSDDWMPLSLKENINRRIELQRKIDEENLTEEQKLEILENISKLKKEIKKEWNIKSQNVQKIYEEIFPIEDKIFYITTLVYNDESIFEEIIYFDNNEKNEVEVWKQTKKYQSIEEYKKSTCLIDKENANNIMTMPVKELLKEQMELKSKPSKTEWKVWVIILVITIVIAVLPNLLPVILAPYLAAAVVATIKIDIAIASVFISGGFKAITSVFSTASKKVESWIYNKIFKNNKDKKEKEKKEVKSVSKDLTSDKLETKLETQFNILKQELDGRKLKTINELMNDKTIINVENNIIPVENQFDVDKANSMDNMQPPTNVRQRRYSF
ncbi:hypothetical protein [Spiroplasma endosymbiont of Tricholauxania praeusta]|uniref:hypothetical protein n=1 Tax=Spiroplasma endosymbiont of Tricholauxania praeusta TaxID=3066296 RepID=UPI0030D55BB7